MRAVSGGASLTTQVGEALREAVLAGELQPGELYSVSQVAEQLGVSRTPVREALLGLADAGLVRVERNRGFRLVIQDAAHLRDVFGVRLMLEVPAARTAARGADELVLDTLKARLRDMHVAARAGDETQFMRHDRAFHDAILAASGNRLLPSVVGGLRDTISAVGASTAQRSRSLQSIAREHEPLLTALAAGDASAAGQAMRVHLTNTRDLLLAQLPTS